MFLHGVGLLREHGMVDEVLDGVCALKTPGKQFSSIFIFYANVLQRRVFQ